NHDRIKPEPTISKPQQAKDKTMTQQPANPASIALTQTEYDNQNKYSAVAYAVWFTLRVVAAHRVYAGDSGYALGLLFTLGGFGVWALIDVAFIGKRIRTLNEQTQQQVFTKYGVNTHASN